MKIRTLNETALKTIQQEAEDLFPVHPFNTLTDVKWSDYVKTKRDVYITGASTRIPLLEEIERLKEIVELHKKHKELLKNNK